MIKAAHPLEGLLASSGLEGFIRKLARLRGPVGKDDVRRGRPRIIVTDKEQSDIVCGICFGKIKSESEYAYCHRRTFHRSCLERVECCPDCHLKYAVRGREGTTTKDIGSPFRLKRMREEPLSDEAVSRCPVCGAGLLEGMGTCSSCGAIFVSPGGSFACPSCGSLVSESASICGNCGEQFRPFVTSACPACGQVVGPNDAVCQCGAVLQEFCPECGTPLPERATECPGCGIVFEFV